MSNVVQFTISAEGAQAVQSMLKFAEAQGKAETGFKKTVNAGNQMERMIGRISSQAIGMLAGFAGFTGVQTLIGNTVQNLQAMRDKATGFEGDMTELLSLGDNMDAIPQVKDQVLTLSAAWGRSRSEITSAMAALQSGTANLSATTQNELLMTSLKMTQLVGGNLKDNMQALVKVYEIYGDEIGTVGRASDKVFRIGDIGAMTFQEMATLIPDVASSAKVMGITFDELGGALAVATQYGGKTEKTFTGVRNVFLRMSKAQEEGIELTGSLTNKISQLAGANPETLKKIFGDEAIGVIANLVAHVNELETAVGKVATASSGIIDEKVAKRLTDASALYAELTAGNKQARENIGLSGEYADTFGNADLRYQLMGQGIESTTPAWMRAIGLHKATEAGLALDLATGRGDADSFGLRTSANEYIQIGARDRIQSLRRGGKTAEADYLEIAYASKGEQGVGLPEGLGRIDLNEADAKRFLRMNADGYRMSANEFRGLRQGEAAFQQTGDIRYKDQVVEILMAAKDAAAAQQKAAEAQAKAADALGKPRSNVNAHTE